MGSARHNSTLKNGIGIGEEMFQETEARTNNDHDREKQEEKGKMVLPVKTSPDYRYHSRKSKILAQGKPVKDRQQML